MGCPLSWLCTQESFRGGKRFHLTLQENVKGKIFIQCSLDHRTTVKALGSLDSGFSLLMGLNSRLIRLHWNHLLLQTNICLCLDSTAGRRVFFSQGTSLIISFTPWVRALPLGQVCCFATMSHVFLKPNILDLNFS